MRSAKMVNLLKSFEEKRVILKRRIHGVKISLVYALKFTSQFTNIEQMPED